MTYTVRSTDIGSLTLNEDDRVSSILQNVAIILNTWKGECPMYRDFGISPDLLHRPINVARVLLHSEIVEAIGKYEPRASIVNVDFEAEAQRPDRLVSIVELEIGEEGEDGT